MEDMKEYPEYEKTEETAEISTDEVSEQEEALNEQAETVETASDLDIDNEPVIEAEFAETEPQTPEPEETHQAERPSAPAAAIQAPPRKNLSARPALVMGLCALLSLGAGFGGGLLANNVNGSSRIMVYTSSEAGTSKVTNVNSAATGMTLSEVADKAAPSVVEVNVEVTQTTYGFFGGTYTSTGAGSGVVISKDGYIITNNHVVKDAQKVSVTTYDGTEYEATVVGTDPKSDIAVIKVEADGLIPAVIGDSAKIKVGDTAVVIGNPLGTLGGTVTDGIISALSREVVIDNEAMELIQTNAAINNGNSGGGMFDGNGNLIGIVNAKDSGTTSSGAVIEGLGFAIPINTAMEVAEELINNGKVTNRATLGVYLTESTSAYFNYPAGLYITEIITGSGAEKAGLQPYDRIVSADGEEIMSYVDLRWVMRNKKVGDSIDLVIERNGEQMDITVELTGTME